VKEIESTGCDIRVWSGECQQPGNVSRDEKFLCRFCEQLPKLDHEVRHDVLPAYVSGDYDNLS